MTASLLVELLVEELPPKSLRVLGDSFASGLVTALRSYGLVAQDACMTPFATPRRLAVHLTEVYSQGPETNLRQKLMPVAVGLGPDGAPTPALLKKMHALGADASVLSTLERATDGKSETLFLHRLMPGTTLAQGLQAALADTLAQLPIAKVMRYQLNDGWESIQFVRPALGLVALHGESIVPVSALGLIAGRQTKGHRFEAVQTPLSIHSADGYAQQLLEEGAVIANFAERRALIEQQLNSVVAQAKVPSARALANESLLDEVCALVERPHVLLCSFDPAYLQVPPECLILSMQTHQKYFPLFDPQGSLTHQFLVVSNIHPLDPTSIIQGNERVVRARLADAKFFFEQDCKNTLESRVAGLGKVVYHAKLGTQAMRVQRLRLIARWVAQQMGSDVGLADRAALLAKADLLTEMVAEFPELQGIMGGYYARRDGEDDAVVKAIQDQYVNRRHSEVESQPVLHALVIADRAEALVGMWGIGLKPTGDKDPFALRRHALTLLDVLTSISALKAFELSDLLEYTASLFDPQVLAQGTVSEVESFIYERYFHQWTALFEAPMVEAVLAMRPPWHQTAARLNAVKAFSLLPQASALAAANKRVRNILLKSKDVQPMAVDANLLQEPAETALHQALLQCVPVAHEAFVAGEYTRSLQILAALRAPVDAFFEQVMVHADEPALRSNRLGLLVQLQAAMNQIADISKLAR